MTQAGDTAEATPAEQLATLRANPELMTQTSFPKAGYDYYVCYDPDADAYDDRVVTLGADFHDESALVVEGHGYPEEEILHHFQLLIAKEEIAGADNPMAALMAMLAAGELDLGDEED